MIAALDPLFVLSNRVEAAFWGAIGVGFLIAAIRNNRRGDALAAALTFVVFGLSDVVESHTGAWWRPWWLLAWKGGCVLVFLILIVGYLHGRDAQADDDQH